MKPSILFPVLTAVLLLLVGCNKGGLPGLVVGKGQVIYDGTPLAGASVTFHPSEGLSDGRRSAIAQTDEQGKFVTVHGF